MNVYLISAVQNLDMHITEMTAIRDRLAGGLGPVIGKDVFPPLPPELVQTLEPASAKAPAGAPGRRKHRTVKSGKESAGATATSEGALAVGRALSEPFTAGDFMGSMACTTKQASNVVFKWHQKGFIKRVGAGQYRRLAAFPGAVAPMKEFAERGYPSVATARAVKVPAAAEAKKVSRATPETTRETRVLPSPEPATGPVAVPGEGKLTPYSPKGIELGKGLKTVFTVEELAGLLPQGKPSAYYFISQWREKHWITKDDFDVYRKQTGFGG